MIDLKIASIGGGDYDLVRGADGDLVLVGETEGTHQYAVLQDITYTLGTWLGESAFDLNAGFPWRELVFGVQPLDGIGALVQDYLLDVDGVEGVSEGPILTFDALTQRLSIVAKVKGKAFAETDLSLEVTAP